MSIEAKFAILGADNAPGQEVRQTAEGLTPLLRGEMLAGRQVDFSHGDVDAHEPTSSAFDLFSAGVAMGGAQAYTKYRGDIGIRNMLAPRLAAFTGAPVDANDRLIVTPGTEFSPNSAPSVRLNFSQDHTAAVQAVERIVTLIERYRA